jgi:hypothetical protein
VSTPRDRREERQFEKRHDRDRREYLNLYGTSMMVSTFSRPPFSQSSKQKLRTAVSLPRHASLGSPFLTVFPFGTALSSDRTSSQSAFQLESHSLCAVDTRLIHSVSPPLHTAKPKTSVLREIQSMMQKQSNHITGHMHFLKGDNEANFSVQEVPTPTQKPHRGPRLPGQEAPKKRHRTYPEIPETVDVLSNSCNTIS